MAYLVTLNIDITKYGGTGVDQASVTFQLSDVMQDVTANTIYAPVKQTVELVAGVGTITLPATKNDPDISPTGLTYLVTIGISPNIQKSFSIEIDKNLGNSQQLADIAPATNVVTTTYASVAAVNSHIAASTNVHGIADTAQLATLAGLATKVDTSTFANVNRTPVLVVASATASAKERALADYVCTGTADDVQIQAAITAINTAGAGIVQLTEGAFTLAAALNMMSGVTLQGTGWGTVLTCTDPHQNLIQTGYAASLQADHFAVRNLKAVGTMLNTEIGAGFAFTNAQNVLIEGCDISSVNDICIYVGSACSDILIRNNVLHDYGNTNTNNGRYGVEVDGFDYGNGLAAPKQVTVIGNHVNGYSGLSMSSNGRTITDIVFADNIINATGASGIVIGGQTGASNMANRFVVANNTITKSGASSVIGILIQAAYAGVVHGNVVYGVSAHGININPLSTNNVKDVAIVNNVVAFCGGSGLNLVASVMPQFSIIDGLVLEGNAASITDSRTNKTFTPIRGVVGQTKSENNGSATITSAATSIAVAHGLYGTPGVVLITPTSALGSAAKWWVSSIGGTNFTINVDVAPGASVSFQWQVRMYA